MAVGNSTIAFTVTNESDTTEVGVAVWKFPSGTTSEQILEEGIFQATSSEDKLITVALPPSAMGTPRELRVLFATPGQYGINCFDMSGGEHDGEELDYVAMLTVKGQPPIAL